MMFSKKRKEEVEREESRGEILEHFFVKSAAFKKRSSALLSSCGTVLLKSHFHWVGV